MNVKKIHKSKLLEIKSLTSSASKRDETGLFVAEGVKIISDMISGSKEVECILATRGFIDNEKNGCILDSITSQNISLYYTDSRSFEKLSLLKNSQGILAVAHKNKNFIQDVPLRARGRMVLCDNIQDPLNLGAIIRTCSAFLIDAVLTYGNCSDLYNPKTIRGSSGTVLNMFAAKIDLPDLKAIKGKGYKVVGATPCASGNISLKELILMNDPAIIAFGNEGGGLSEEIVRMTDMSFNIPISKSVESLNVNAAVAVTLYAIKNK